MRAILVSCIGLIAVLGASQQASAAFSFILSPTSGSISPVTGNVVLTVSARDTNAGLFGTQFQLGSILNVTGGSGNITFSNLTPFVANTTVYTATNAAGGNAIGTITATAVAPGGVSTLAFRGTLGANNIDGGLVVGTTSTSNTATISAVPEPTSLALVGIGGLGYVFYRKRRASKA